MLASRLACAMRTKPCLPTGGQIGPRASRAPTSDTDATGTRLPFRMGNILMAWQTSPILRSPEGLCRSYSDALHFAETEI